MSSPDSRQNYTAFHPEMRLEMLPAQPDLDAIFYELGGVALGIALGGNEYKDYDNLVNSVGSLDGIDVIEPGYFEHDEYYRCAHYAFGKVHGAKWAMPPAPLNVNEQLRYRPIPFLRQRGYDLTPEPKPGDIVAYGNLSLEDMERREEGFEHYGVLQPDGKIVSKFSIGPIVKHTIDLVPESYGNRVNFLRKRRLPRPTEPKLGLYR
jgi:hypothetical protein